MPNTVYAASPEPSAARLSHLLACAARLPSSPVIVTALLASLADKLAHVLAAPCGRGDLLPLCTTALAALGSRDTAADVLAELECQAAAAAELAPDFE